MTKKKSESDQKKINQRGVDQVSVITTENLDNLTPTFKNKIFFDFVFTSLKQSENGTKDLSSCAKDAKSFIEALNPENSLQLLLAAQIASMHQTHQKILAYANNEQRIDQMQTYINLSIKLSNVVNQQVLLMQKLQGGHQQKVVIEHVSINGGQAVVGTINTTSTKEVKK